MHLAWAPFHPRDQSRTRHYSPALELSYHVRANSNRQYTPANSHAIPASSVFPLQPAASPRPQCSLQQCLICIYELQPLSAAIQAATHGRGHHEGATVEHLLQ